MLTQGELEAFYASFQDDASIGGLIDDCEHAYDSHAYSVLFVRNNESGDPIKHKEVLEFGFPEETQ